MQCIDFRAVRVLVLRLSGSKKQPHDTVKLGVHKIGRSLGCLPSSDCEAPTLRGIAHLLPPRRFLPVVDTPKKMRSSHGLCLLLLSGNQKGIFVTRELMHHSCVYSDIFCRTISGFSSPRECAHFPCFPCTNDERAPLPRSLRFAIHVCFGYLQAIEVL